MNDNPKKVFEMTEPASHGSGTKYAFWLTTDMERLIEFVETLLCVQGIKRQGDDKTRVLVNIKDRFDADEAWHYIRSELEAESHFVELDKIWEDALWL